MTTCLATVGHHQGTEMYIEENYMEYGHCIGAYSKQDLIESLEYAPVLWSYSV